MRRYLLVPTIITLILLIALGSGEKVFAADFNLNREELIRQVECELFDKKIDLAKKSIVEDLERGYITEIQAKEQLAYIKTLEDNFEIGILPREVNRLENTYGKPYYNNQRPYIYNENPNISNGYGSHHLDPNHFNYNNHSRRHNSKGHHNGRCVRY